MFCFFYLITNIFQPQGGSIAERAGKPTCSTPVMNTEQPMSRKMTRPVSLCSLMPRKRGCSPGAELSDSSFKLLTWEMDRTVAATNHGRPMMEHTASITPTISRSRWYPQPFCKTERGRPGSDQTGGCIRTDQQEAPLPSGAGLVWQLTGFFV